MDTRPASLELHPKGPTESFVSCILFDGGGCVDERTAERRSNPFVECARTRIEGWPASACKSFLEHPPQESRPLLGRSLEAVGANQ